MDLINIFSRNEIKLVYYRNNKAILGGKKKLGKRNSSVFKWKKFHLLQGQVRFSEQQIFERGGWNLLGTGFY